MDRSILNSGFWIVLALLLLGLVADIHAQGPVYYYMPGGFCSPQPAACQAACQACPTRDICGNITVNTFGSCQTPICGSCQTGRITPSAAPARPSSPTASPTPASSTLQNGSSRQTAGRTMPPLAMSASVPRSAADSRSELVPVQRSTPIRSPGPIFLASSGPTRDMAATAPSPAMQAGQVMTSSPAVSLSGAPIGLASIYGSPPDSNRFTRPRVDPVIDSGYRLPSVAGSSTVPAARTATTSGSWARADQVGGTRLDRTILR